MAHFKFKPESSITPEDFYSYIEAPEPVGGDGVIHEGLLDGFKAAVTGPAKEMPEELKNQFVVFQIAATESGQTIAEASTLEPHYDGSAEQPDMFMNIEMQSFHLAKSETVDKETRATMRLIIGKDRNSRNKMLDDVFWTVSAGLDFYNRNKNERAKPNEYQSDFSKAFGDRPIEIPGGLANITFEVVKHKEASWWKKTFGFLTSDAGRSLTSIIGFPGITQNAIGLLDEVFSRFDRSKTETIFESRSMILALTKQAKMDYTQGNPRIRMGSINPGFCVLARGRDFFKIANADAYFYPHYGVLVPSTVSPGDLVSGNYEDPFEDITYVVFKIGMLPTKLEMRFNYGLTNS